MSSKEQSEFQTRSGFPKEPLDSAQDDDGEFQTDFFASDPSVPKPSPPVSFATKRPLRILITDDNPINRNVIRTVLQRLGYEPSEASSGAETLELVREGNIDYLFTDIDMPEMDGIEVALAIRALEKVAKKDLRKLEIVAVTANVAPETRKKCAQAGMNGFLEKPVDLDAIKSQLLKSWRRIKARSSRA